MIKIKSSKMLKCVISVFILLIVGGCNKGGSETTGSTTEGAGAGADKVLSFNPAGIPVDNSVYLEKKSVADNEIILNVKIKGGKDVYGSAIELVYDGSKIMYVSSSKGSYLGGEDEILFNAELEKGQEGTLLAGVYKKGNTTGISGNGTLFTIVFRVLTEQANTVIKFNAANCVLKTLKSPTGNISGTSWFGGSLSYR